MERQQTYMRAALNNNNIDCQNHNVLRHTFSVTAIQKGISKDGICQESKAEYANGNLSTKPAEQVAAAIERCWLEYHTGDNLLANPVPYENPESSVNVAIDDVIVKKQEETRECGKKSDCGKRKNEAAQ